MLKGCKSSATPANPPLCVELHWIHIKGTNFFVFKDFFFHTFGPICHWEKVERKEE